MAKTIMSNFKCRCLTRNSINCGQCHRFNYCAAHTHTHTNERIQKEQHFPTHKHTHTHTRHKTVSPTHIPAEYKGRTHTVDIFLAICFFFFIFVLWCSFFSFNINSFLLHSGLYNFTSLRFSFNFSLQAAELKKINKKKLS